MSNSTEEFITLTVIKASIKKDVRERFHSLFKPLEDDEPKKDDYGRDAEFYKDLGIDPPEDLYSYEDDDDEGDYKEEVFHITKEDYDIVERIGKFRPAVISFIVDNEDVGSTLYIKTDFTISVKENAEEVEQKIKLVQTNN